MCLEKNMPKNSEATINFVVFGEPVAQGRPRTAVIGGRAIVYDPAKSRNFKQLVAAVAQEHAPAQLIDGPVAINIKVFRAIPKSFSKKKRKRHYRDLSDLLKNRTLVTFARLSRMRLKVLLSAMIAR